MKDETFVVGTNEKGEKVNFQLIDTLTIDENKYVIVSERDSDNAYAYRTVEQNGETKFASIGDGEEFQKVLKKFNANK